MAERNDTFPSRSWIIFLAANRDLPDPKSLRVRAVGNQACDHRHFWSYSDKAGTTTASLNLVICT
jgi:hypothetical protein